MYHNTTWGPTPDSRITETPLIDLMTTTRGPWHVPGGLLTWEQGSKDPHNPQPNILYEVNHRKETQTSPNKHLEELFKCGSGMTWDPRSPASASQ